MNIVLATNDNQFRKPTIVNHKSKIVNLLYDIFNRLCCVAVKIFRNTIFNSFSRCAPEIPTNGNNCTTRSRILSTTDLENKAISWSSRSFSAIGDSTFLSHRVAMSSVVFLRSPASPIWHSSTSLNRCLLYVDSQKVSLDLSKKYFSTRSKKRLYIPI